MRRTYSAEFKKNDIFLYNKNLCYATESRKKRAIQDVREAHC